MKVGFDRHGVLDKNPEFFIKVVRQLKSEGHEIHVLSGHEEADTRSRLAALGFDPDKDFDAVFSIVDHNRRAGTPMEERGGSWWMSDEAWDRSKGDYAARVGLDVHFDDSPEYARFFPRSCKFLTVMPGDSEEYLLKTLDMFVS